MTGDLTSQPPRAWARLQEPDDAEGAACGALCRVLAASRSGGVFLALGRGAGALGTWIQDGMDLSSRLVVVVDDEAAATLRPVFADDLRVTVHVQDAAEFLDDVHAHRFDLIADLGPGEAAPLALGALAAGGFYVSPQGIPVLSEALAHAGHGEDADIQSLVFTRLPGEPGITLVVRGPQRVRARRRGGRRARQGVTPLFASRPRRRDD